MLIYFSCHLSKASLQSNEQCLNLNGVLLIWSYWLWKMFHRCPLPYSNWWQWHPIRFLLISQWWESETMTNLSALFLRRPMILLRLLCPQSICLIFQISRTLCCFFLVNILHACRKCAQNEQSNLLYWNWRKRSLCPSAQSNLFIKNGSCNFHHKKHWHWSPSFTYNAGVPLMM